MKHAIVTLFVDNFQTLVSMVGTPLRKLIVAYAPNGITLCWF